MDKKSKIVKFKSNSATNSKISKISSKKCKSNVGFYSQAVTRRRVYVRRNLKTSADDERSDIPVNSVASKFLSKCTTGTQYPDNKENDYPKQKNRNKQKYEGKPSVSKKKPKEESINNSTQLKNDVIQAQISNFEAGLSISNVNEIYGLSEKNTLKQIFKNAEIGTAKGSAELVKEVLKVKSESITDAETTHLADSVDDKEMYNILVDLLKTTLSVCNVTDTISEESNLKIQESVVNKLNIKEQDKSVTAYLSNYKIKGSKFINTNNEVRTVKPLSKQCNVNPLSKLTPRETSKIFNKGKLPAKSIKYQFKNMTKKQNVINDLKQQLETEIKNDIFREPQNFFEALKFIALNKKRAEMSCDFCKSRRNQMTNVECIKIIT